MSLHAGDYAMLLLFIKFYQEMKFWILRCLIKDQCFNIFILTSVETLKESILCKRNLNRDWILFRLHTYRKVKNILKLPSKFQVQKSLRCAYCAVKLYSMFKEKLSVNAKYFLVHFLNSNFLFFSWSTLEYFF